MGLTNMVIAAHVYDKSRKRSNKKEIKKEIEDNKTSSNLGGSYRDWSRIGDLILAYSDLILNQKKSNVDIGLYLYEIYMKIYNKNNELLNSDKEAIQLEIDEIKKQREEKILALIDEIVDKDSELQEFILKKYNKLVKENKEIKLKYGILDMSLLNIILEYDMDKAEKIIKENDEQYNKLEKLEKKKEQFIHFFEREKLSREYDDLIMHLNFRKTIINDLKIVHLYNLKHPDSITRLKKIINECLMLEEKIEKKRIEMNGKSGRDYILSAIETLLENQEMSIEDLSQFFNVLEELYTKINNNEIKEELLEKRENRSEYNDFYQAVLLFNKNIERIRYHFISPIRTHKEYNNEKENDEKNVKRK